MGAVSTVVPVLCRWCLMFRPGSPGGVTGRRFGSCELNCAELSLSACTFLGMAGTSGTVSLASLVSLSSEYAVEVDVSLNCSLSFCASRRLVCWLTQESTVRKRGTDDRDVMYESRPWAWAWLLFVSRAGSWGVWGALELVQLNLLMTLPRPPLFPDADGRLKRNCLKVGGGGRGDKGRSCGGSAYWISDPSSTTDRVLRVDALRRRLFESGPSALEDGVGDSLRRSDGFRPGGGGSRRKDLGWVGEEAVRVEGSRFRVKLSLRSIPIKGRWDAEEPDRVMAAWGAMTDCSVMEPYAFACLVSR